MILSDICTTSSDLSWILSYLHGAVCRRIISLDHSDSMYLWNLNSKYLNRGYFEYEIISDDAYSILMEIPWQIFRHPFLLMDMCNTLLCMKYFNPAVVRILSWAHNPWGGWFMWAVTETSLMQAYASVLIAESVTRSITT